MAEPASLKGSIERITFYNDENGYIVARFIAEPGAAYAGREPVTVIGNMLGVNVGEPVQIEGTWVNNPKYGRQFKVERFTVELPTTTDGIRRYLGSGLIKGVGPVTSMIPSGSEISFSIRSWSSLSTARAASSNRASSTICNACSPAPPRSIRRRAWRRAGCRSEIFLSILDPRTGRRKRVSRTAC